MGFCATPAAKPIATPTLPREINCGNLHSFSKPEGQLLTEAQGPLLISVKPVAPFGDTVGSIVMVHDMSFVQRREETKRYLFYFFVALGVVVALITVVIAQMCWRGWVAAACGAAARRRTAASPPGMAIRRRGAAADRARPAQADRDLEAEQPAARRGPA